MSRYSNKKGTSPETQSEANRLAKSSQRPGQTKAQTRLIAKGIEKGIEAYKREQKARSRELNKRLKTARGGAETVATTKVESVERIVVRQHWLPWALLAVSWLGMGSYLMLY